jgi:hypothetical protein
MPDVSKPRRATLGSGAASRSQPTDQTSECASASASSVDERGGRRLVRLTDRRLAELVAADATTVNWDVLRVRVGAWSKAVCTDNRDFAVYTARARSSGAHLVAAIGAVSASTTELRAILRPSSSEAYAATMSELYGQEFIYGSIVHRASSEAALTADVVSRRVSDVTVKTATFEKQHAFARSEAWCYADGVHPVGDSKGFAVVMTPVDPDDVFAGKTSATVSELVDLHASYAVVPSEDARLVRVSFYAHFTPNQLNTRSGGGKGSRGRRSASTRAMDVRLMRMAEATGRLAVIVRRRRLGAQVYANHNAFRPANARCVCCTSKFSPLLGRKKKKCHLCGYFVCENSCSTKHAMERPQTGGQRVFTVRICEHCMERVDAADYDNLPSSGASVPMIHPKAPDAESSTVALARLLRDTLVAAPTDKKSAVKSVIMNLIDEEDAGREEDEASRQRALTAQSTESEYLAALDTRLHVKELSVDQCVLANARSRTYPLAYNTRETVPMHPLPPDEDARLNAIRRQRLDDVRNLPELELICTLASRELGCSIGFVTVVGRDATFVLATNREYMRNKVIPREESLCSYTIMSDKPTLVPHPEADVRFSKQDVVVNGGLRFYFAFPLFAPDRKTVVGAVCCAHSESLPVDAAQYATLAKLSDSATRLLAVRLKDDDDSWAALGRDVRAIESGL